MRKSGKAVDYARATCTEGERFAKWLAFAGATCIVVGVVITAIAELWTRSLDTRDLGLLQIVFGIGFCGVAEVIKVQSK